MHSIIQSFNHSIIQTFNHASIRPSVHPSMHPCIHALMHSFIQSFSHAFIQPFNRSTTQEPARVYKWMQMNQRHPGNLRLILLCVSTFYYTTTWKNPGPTCPYPPSVALNTKQKNMSFIWWVQDSSHHQDYIVGWQEIPSEKTWLPVGTLKGGPSTPRYTGSCWFRFSSTYTNNQTLLITYKHSWLKTHIFFE